MFSRAGLLVVVVATLSIAAEGRPNPHLGAVGDLARRGISGGLPNRVPAQIAGLLGVAPDAPVHQVKVSEDQAADGMSHLLKVLVELSTTTPPVPIGPTGFVFYAHRTEGDTIRGYWYSASLDGELRSSVVTEGKADERGIAIKGSGAATRQEIVAPAIKEAFQHEVDLWLRRTHLKKEWRNAQFSGGVLQKKRKPR